MNSKTTGVWFVIAAALAAFIFIFQHWLRPAVFEPSAILPGLRPAAITSVQVVPPDALEIRADRTNGVWLLTRPVFYPAQTAAVEALLDALQKLMPVTRITAGELRDRPDADAEFGFKNPTSLIIEAGGQRWELHIGHKTAPGNDVYLRVFGVDGAFVADADWLKFIPHSADEWRDTALVDADQNRFDWIVLTNNARSTASQPLIIELRRDPTNHLWRMIRPLQARADADHITDSLERLQAAQATQFVTDNPQADLTAFGLQPAELDLWLGQGTNLVAAIHAGRSPTNDPTQVYVKRESWNTIFATAKDSLSPWYGQVNNFRDTNLLELTAPVVEIEMSGPDTNHFILQRHGSNEWSVVGEKFPADAENARAFIKFLAGLRIADFVKDVVTTPDLQTYGLTTPTRQIALRSAVGDTNAVIAQILFGATQTNEVFVKRSDEDFVYGLSPADLDQMWEFDYGWQFRDRRIWNFNVNDVAQIILHQNGRMRQIIHGGPGKWSLAAGSQGIITDRYIEQAVEQISHLTAAAWIGRNMTNLDKLGWNTNNLQITVALKNGTTNTVDFVRDLPQGQTALAAVTLDGECWGFVFPVVPYQFVLSYLTIPVPQGGMP